MTKDEIIKLVTDACEDGKEAIHGEWVEIDFVELERFAALVAEKEREACAKVCEGHKIDGQLVHSNAVVGCAAAIRARGNK